MTTVTSTETITITEADGTVIEVSGPRGPQGATGAVGAAGADADVSALLVKANNLSDIASAETARANLGLGTMATATASDYLSKAGNLGGIADLAVARTNLGLGTMATASASAYALLTGATFTGDVTFGTTSGIRLGYGGRFFDPDATRTMLLANGNKFDVLDETGASYLFQAGGNGVGLIATNGLTANANAASVVPLVAKGYASHNADFFTVQNSAGTKLGGWDKYGQLNTQYITDTTGVSPYLRFQTNSLMAINQGNAANVAFAVRGMAAQSGALTLWQDSSSNTLASIYSDGSLLTPKIYVGSDGVGNSGSFGNASYEPTLGGSRINTSTQTNTALTVRNSHASASGKLQSWQVTTSNTEVASISAAGKGFFADVATSAGGVGSLFTQYIQYGAGLGPYIQLTSTNGTVAIRSRATTEVPATVNGVASQTAALQAWQVNGADLLSVTAAGLPRWNAAANQQTTVGAAGGASALPGTPTKYLKVVDSTGATLVIPAYAAA